MTYVVYATAPIPAPAIPSPWRGMVHTFTDWQGNVWDLTDWSSAGVMLTAEGVRGLSDPQVTDYTDDAAGVDGQRFRGFRVEARDCLWNILVFSDTSSAEFVERDRAFGRALRPGRYGTWTVTLDDGSFRSLRVRAVPGGDTEFDRDPVQAGWAAYQVKLVADDPYWYGATVENPFVVEAATNFTTTEDAAQDGFSVWGGAGVDTASIANDGDVSSWPVWTAADGLTTPIVGVGGKTIALPTVTTGHTFVVDTSPATRTATLDGVDATSSLGAAEFAPVPAGGVQALSITATGTGTIKAAIRPRYYRAY